MNKTDLIKKLSDVTGLAQKDTRAILDALTEPKGIISKTLGKNGKVIISGFGTFYVRERSARKARNPRTGTKVKVPKRRYPAFKAAKTMKDALKK